MKIQLTLVQYCYGDLSSIRNLFKNQSFEIDDNFEFRLIDQVATEFVISLQKEI